MKQPEMRQHLADLIELHNWAGQDQAQRIDDLFDRISATLTVEVIPRNVHGQQRFYPGNTLARQFVRLMDSTTLTLDQLRLLEELGYTIKPTADVDEFKRVLKGE